MNTEITEVIEIVEIVKVDNEVVEIVDEVIEIVEVQHGSSPAHDHDSLVVKVRYITARKPFVDPRAPRNETLGALKPRVLDFFGLVEGSTGGGTKSYHFALNGIVQTNLATELGSLAHGEHELKLDLIERFEQG